MPGTETIEIEGLEILPDKWPAEVDLIISALARTDRRIRLIVAGEGPLRGQLEEKAAAMGVADRVTFTGKVSDEELVKRYAGAMAVVFPPFDEDYGYVTLEAFLARKPVITTTDAGGPLEFVEDGVTGVVAEPTAESLGAAIARLASDPRRARALGDAGFERVRDISWDHVVDRLMADG